MSPNTREVWAVRAAEAGLLAVYLDQPSAARYAAIAAKEHGQPCVVEALPLMTPKIRALVEAAIEVTEAEMDRSKVLMAWQRSQIGKPDGYQDAELLDVMETSRMRCAIAITLLDHAVTEYKAEQGIK